MAGTDSRDDEMLTAFLDGALAPAEYGTLLQRLAADAALRARLEQLQDAGHGVADAMAGLLEAAPVVRLDAILDATLAGAAPVRPATTPQRRSWLGFRLAPLAAVAAMLAVAIIAGGIGYGLGGGAPKPAETWLEAVAEYWQLTTAETLAIEPPAGLADSQLALASSALGLPLSMTGVALDGPSFRGAQLYAFNGKPLVQIAFLDADYGPIAYCVIRNGRPDTFGPKTAEIGGFNVVHWQSDGVGRMLIGQAPPDRLAALAARLKERAGQGA